MKTDGVCVSPSTYIPPKNHRCEELAANLAKQSVAGPYRIEAIHGDRDQHERSLIMRRFKLGEVCACARGYV